jgi:hypothetical protein
MVSMKKHVDNKHGATTYELIQKKKKKKKITYESVDGGWAKREKMENNASQLYH